MRESQLWDIKSLLFLVLALITTTWVMWLWMGMAVGATIASIWYARKEKIAELMKMRIMLEHVARMEGIDLSKDGALKNKEKPDESA